MLNTLSIGNRSFSVDSVITHILQYFWVPIAEPSHDEPKELGDEVIASLGFGWVDDQ